MPIELIEPPKTTGFLCIQCLAWWQEIEDKMRRQGAGMKDWERAFMKFVKESSWSKGGRNQL